MRTAKRILTLAVSLAAMSSLASAYYYWVLFPGNLGPFAPISAHFDLSALKDNTVQYFISDLGPGALMPGDDTTAIYSQIHQAARVWNIDLGSSFIVGDRWRDIAAGHRAGCHPIFVDYGYAEQRPDGPFVGVRSLREAAQWILRTTRPGFQLETLQHA